MADEDELAGEREPHVIAEKAISRWLSIPEEAEIAVRITRRDFDHLFFSIRELEHSVALIETAVMALVNGKADDAPAAISQSHAHLFSSSDRLSRMMEYVMDHAEVLK